ncbi:glycosyltransferase family 2 protein [Actinomyces vulturis]|uniref:glycosyltransferase family 2 protein n=1 Tax=Actinomyces vulturis TaxID=1857645 RepID=UPI0008365080|nr:glycosyltransferase family 2 protein [Actinomyces vulturis]
MTQSLLVIIPAWNEEKSVGTVVTSVRHSLPWADVLVVSDGSTDSTALVAQEAGAIVLDLPLNLGVGGAMRAGFVFAQRNGYDTAVQVDADGQHDPRDIPSLITCMNEEGADVVIGARFAGVGSYAVRGPRKWAMALLRHVMSKLSKTHLTDVTSGFKLYSRRAILLFSQHYPAEYLGDTIEAMIVGIRSGLVVRQVGVEMHARTAGQPSHSPIKAAIYLLRAFMAMCIALSSPRFTIEKA